MVSYPYITIFERLRKFLKHIQSAGVPPRITQDYLSKAGYRSSNDRSIIPILRFLEFIKSDGTPTEFYVRYRNKQEAPSVMATAIKKAYNDLFSMYPNACEQDAEALRNYFSSQTSAGERALQMMVGTFRILCKEADFKVETLKEVPVEISKPAEPAEPAAREPVVKESGVTSLNINLQITLPETTNNEIYKEIFKAMRKYLIEGTE